MVSTGGSPLSGNIGPAVARVDQSQPGQGEVAHGACGHANILAELRLDENHYGAGKVGA